LDFNLSVDGGLAISKIGGTLPYMAPEQLALASEPDTADRRWPYDPRSDLFSLGVMLYELLAGVLPFGGIPAGRTIEELAAALRQRQAQGPGPLEEHHGRSERPLARLIESCLAFDPEQRPQTAGHLAAQLRQELSPPRRARRWVRTNRRPMAAIGCAILAIVLAAAAALAMRPPYSVRQFHQGLDYAQRGDYTTAEACFSDALRSDPENREILIARADALSKQGDFRMAFEDYRTARELAPEPILAARMGYCLGRLARIIHECSRAGG
jgi:tetratricopeptide (TPR) repeat protein